MQPALSTRRLRLEPLAPHHGDALYALSRDADVMRWSSLPPQTRVQTDALLREWLANARSGKVCCWVLTEHTDAFVGQISLFGIDRDNLRAEIGYMLMPAHWRRGFAGEAIAAAVRYAFGHLKLCRLEADVDPNNTGSWRALEKNGFHREGLLRQRWYKEGRFYDAYFYGLLNERRIDELRQAG